MCQNDQTIINSVVRFEGAIVGDRNPMLKATQTGTTHFGPLSGVRVSLRPPLPSIRCRQPSGLDLLLR